MNKILILKIEIQQAIAAGNFAKAQKLALLLKIQQEIAAKKDAQ
jgi:hypothetical protein